ncbi:MAG: YicC family protein [Chitinispirillaceae bacterium]|nr:YicC family protein [Chitinispirillaceae bacterium]
MTGFGSSQGTTPSGTYRIEIRGVNNRFFELQLRQPRFVNNLEQQVKKEILSVISRGSLTVLITCDREDADKRFSYDRSTVEGYVGILQELRKKFRLDGGVTLDNLLTFSDIIQADVDTYDDRVIWKHIRPVLADALAAFQKHRESEAVFIRKEMRHVLGRIKKTLAVIEKRAPVRMRAYSESLRERIKKLGAVEVDPTRIAMEIALLSDRLDIAEECTRLRAHLAKFSDDFEGTEPAGKRLGFLLQEMNREANTIGAKANDTQIAHMSVQLKEDIEKIREQIQNIE